MSSTVSSLEHWLKDYSHEHFAIIPVEFQAAFLICRKLYSWWQPSVSWGIQTIPQGGGVSGKMWGVLQFFWVAVYLFLSSTMAESTVSKITWSTSIFLAISLHIFKLKGEAEGSEEWLESEWLMVRWMHDYVSEWASLTEINKDMKGSPGGLFNVLCCQTCRQTRGQGIYR